jgi:hypothetical protein
MNFKTTIATSAVLGAALAASTASAALVNTGSLSTWLSNAGGNGIASSWVIPSNAPNGNYDWFGQVNVTSSAAATIGDDGFYYAGISVSAGDGLSTTSGSTLSILASGAPVTVTFTFNANVVGAGFLVSSATPPTSITVFNNGSVGTSSAIAVDPSLNGGGTGYGFFGVYETSSTSSFTSISITLNANQTLVLSGAYLQLVPAPGAVALLGVAGMVGSRRRR